MRVAKLRVENFRGIRLVDLVDLDAKPLLTISGRNGAGKTQLLEAIATLWSGRWYQPERLVGPWSQDGLINLEVALTDAEAEAVMEFRRLANGSSDECPTRLSRTLEFNVTGITSNRNSHAAFDTLTEATFRRLHPFATIDFFPADRRIARNDNPAIDPEMVGTQRTEEFRTTLLETAIRQRQQAELPAVASFLATLDYLDLVAGRNGDLGRSFADITDVFFTATGKQVTAPESSVDTGVKITVTTEAGASHPVSELSRGEQEALGLIYFIHRLAARGGVLLLDEPELHLHPTLQGSLLEVVQSLGERSQIWAVTHSPKLLTAAPMNGIVHMRPPEVTVRNQATWALDEEARTGLLADLGMHPADLMQHDLILIVEGPTDEESLRALFPVELGRSLVHTAGGSRALEDVAATLMRLDNPLPWIAVRDRDFLSRDEVSALSDKFGDRLFVWPRRSIENHLLDPALIREAITRAGGAAAEEEIAQVLRRLAESEKEEVLARMLEARLEGAFPVVGTPRTHGADDLRTWYQGVYEAAGNRVSRFDTLRLETTDELERRWPDEWMGLVQAKTLLPRMLPAIQTPFRNYAALRSALMATARTEPAVMPAPINDLRLRIRALLPQRR